MIIKKRQESNWKFDSRPQTPWKQGSNELWLGHVINLSLPPWANLGQSHKAHLRFKKSINRGNMSSLNNILEVTISIWWLCYIDLWKISSHFLKLGLAWCSIAPSLRIGIPRNNFNIVTPQSGIKNNFLKHQPSLIFKQFENVLSIVLP
jgi:hypothetical protein